MKIGLNHFINLISAGYKKKEVRMMVAIILKLCHYGLGNFNYI
jgi:hypothetical protein